MSEGIKYWTRVADLSSAFDALLYDPEFKGYIDTSRIMAALLPDAVIERIEPALHFTATPVCKPAGAAILLEENDDPVCTDLTGTTRAAVHGTIIEAMAGELGL